ncbi:MAG: DUF2752 domain-containing protein [Muribaculaceae bacterium]|nr:DUF2752 domain-containing protein [Muribaculaceae bacterium]
MTQDGKRKIKVLSAICALIMFAAVYAAFDPAEAYWMPKCITFMITGYKCPGCGSQRMIHSLLTGNLAEAFRQNAFLVLMIPVIIFLIWLEFNRTRHRHLYIRIYGKWGCIVFCLLATGWTVLRNIFNL